MRRAIIILLLSGCLPFEVPQRPDYDASCRPSDMTFVEMAKSEKDIPSLDGISKDPKVAYQQALEVAKQRNLVVRKKKDTDIDAWDGFSTTLPGVILLSKDWDEKSDEEKAWLMWHEAGVHGSQYHRMAPQRFLAWYAVAEGRWSLELPAYVMIFRLQLHFGHSPEKVAKSIDQSAPIIHDKYILDQMPSCTVETTRQILMAGAGL